MKQEIKDYFDVATGYSFRLGSYLFVAQLVSGVRLYAPEEYWLLTDEDKKAMGCGPGKWGDYLVPDTMYGLNVQPSCSIHDTCYALGKTDEDKIIADVMMLMNNLAIIQAKSWPLIRAARCYRAMSYFLAVSEGGEKAFWKGKTKP